MISPVFIAAFGLFILSTSTSTLTQAQPAVLIGVTEEGKRCKAPLECKSPLYCVPKGGANMKTEYTCEKMPCGPLTPCSIGLQCGGDGFCEGVPCSDDKQCLGITVCGAAESRCKPKVSSGNSCVRDAECWSDKCEDEICLSAALEEEKEVAYSRNRNRNRGADIALGVLGLLSLLTALLLCILCLKGDNMLSKSASDDEDTEDPRVPVPEMKINSPATSIADRLKGGAAGAVGTAKNGAVAVGDSVRNGTTSGLETAKNGAAAAGDAVRSGTTAAVDTSRKLAGAAVDTGRKAANTAAAKAGDAVPDSVKNAAARAGDTAKEGAHRVAEGASDAAEAAKNAAAGAVDAARNAVRR